MTLKLCVEIQDGLFTNGSSDLILILGCMTSNLLVLEILCFVFLVFFYGELSL